MIFSETNSALLSIKWDWTSMDVSGKHTRQQEAYKYSPSRYAKGGGTEEGYPFEVIDTKLRVPGNGRTMVVRYESSTGKDFILLGHTLSGIERTESEARK